MNTRQEQEMSVGMRHPTAKEWQELTAALTAMGQLLAEQGITLTELAARPCGWPTRDQATEMLREMKEIQRLLEQAGEKRTRRWTPPRVHLPRLSMEWLLFPAALLGLAVLWFSWNALASGVKAVFS